MHSSGPLTFREYKDDYYILVTVDRLTRYPHAQVYKNCDTETVLKYLEEYCNFHGIPRSIECDQPQAFKAREFELYCKDKNLKLILAPAGDHRATGIVERLIQTIKRRIAIMQSDPLWSNADLAQIVTKIIQSIRLIPNSVTKIKPFEAHFGRPPNTELSNIIIKPNKTKLTYIKIRSFVSDKTKLKHPTLPRGYVGSWPRFGTGIRSSTRMKSHHIVYSRAHYHRTPQIQRTHRCLATRAFLVGILHLN